MLTLEQLLYGLMFPREMTRAQPSRYIAGSVEAFADMMNEEAARIGAVDTHFVNPHGLHDPDHYTTAYDLYLIFHEAMKDAIPEIAGSTPIRPPTGKKAARPSPRHGRAETGS